MIWKESYKMIQKESKSSLQREKNKRKANGKKKNESLKERESKRFQCKVCFKVCTRNWCLKIHMKQHNGSERKKCENCMKVFNTFSGFNTHMEAQVECDVCQLKICSNKMWNKYTLLKHMEAHLGEIKLKCQICNTTYELKSVESYVCQVTSWQCQSCRQGDLLLMKGTQKPGI